MMKRLKGYVSFILILIIFTACGKKNEESILVIAEQYGLAYAPIQIMKEKGFLKELLPDTRIEWITLGNTTEIREAMLAGRLDIGFMAIPPFLIGCDNGMDWRMICGLSKNPSGLVVNDPRLKDLSDFTDADKIAVPQPGSVQHILLAMECERQFQDAGKLDHLLVTMKHPDAYLSMESKSTIKAHFTSPPYLFEEVKNENNHMILSGEEAFGGEFTFIVGVCQKEMFDDKEQYKAVLEGLEMAMDFMEAEREATISILSECYSMDPDTLKGYLKDEGMEYSKEIEGAQGFADFMLRNGYLKNEIDLANLTWE